MLEPASDAAGRLRAFLTIGSGTVAEHQLALALALESQRIVCLARGMSGELITLQHRAERAGAQFHVISDARGLSALVTAGDEVLVLADGLVVIPQPALDLLKGSHMVLVQPAEIGLPAGYERIDLETASAGAMRIPGRLVERLNELPADCDVVSALTRIALQGGVSRRELPDALRIDQGWHLARTESEAESIEAGWIGRQLAASGVTDFGHLLASLVTRLLAAPLFHAGNGGTALAAVAGVLLVLALSFGWFGFPAAGLVTAAVAWLIRICASAMLRMERTFLGTPDGRWRRKKIYSWALDASLVAILTWNLTDTDLYSFWQRLFGPVMLLAMIRLLPRVIAERWTAWVEDRLLLALALALAAAFGRLAPAVTLLAMGLAALEILWPARQTRITPA